jgi:hypothetical protein
MNPETKAVAGLEAKVANFKLIARNALRMELISPRLSKITALENDVKELNDCVKAHEHAVLVETYEIGKMDKEHPDYTEDKKYKEEAVKSFTESIEETKKDIVEVEKLVAEQKEGIAKIESGETLVSLERLNEMVEALVKQDALNQVTV